MNEVINELSKVIEDMYMEYPSEWVLKAFLQAQKKALTHHVELDSCGKAVWVKND